ncbi:MAG: hypothetical protein Q8L36_02960 [bacterium]|nr:hypothetical protein [bacterium]
MILRKIIKKKKHPSNSSVQLEIERFIIEKLRLDSGKHTKFSDSYVDLDGKNEDGFFEIYAHIGELKVGSCRKIINDAVKLFLAAKFNKKKNKTIIFVDGSIEKRFKGNSWHSVVFREFGIDIKIVKIPLYLEKKLKDAQIRQAKGIVKRKK